MTVGMCRMLAAIRVGPLAKPPTPMTTSGLNRFKMAMAWLMLLVSFSGKVSALRSFVKPLIHRPSMG